MDARLYKGSLETIILKLLAEKQEMYGYQITQEVKAISQGEIDIKEGSLYPCLHRMEADGLIVAESKPYGKRIRKYYHLSEKGQKTTISYIEEMNKYLAVMQSILQPKSV
jgi:DNA-binding PadR family transcriptional regulator